MLPATVAGPIFAFDANGVTAETQLPSIDFQSRKVKFITVNYQMPDAASYDWGVAPTAPSFVGVDSIIWHIPVANSISSIPVTVTNHNAETHDNILIFVAGIFLGTAGAALIAGFQEGFIAFENRPGGPGSGRRRRTIRA